MTTFSCLSLFSPAPSPKIGALNGVDGMDNSLQLKGYTQSGRLFSLGSLCFLRASLCVKLNYVVYKNAYE